ncbi:histidinol-phosphate transaminase [Thermotoga caldifontis]|uniref:histidinol-phosphate transaminase n=1 Tax=Thermotoga caldifontis TaxID=1508419 RepID=UPI000596B0BA|nr:histidinol-phosphate transaminase [Thermotoga caldifontis]
MSFSSVVEEIRKNVEAYRSEPRTLTYLALNENPYPFPEELVRECFERIDASRLPTYVDSPSEEFLNELVDYVSIGGWKAQKEQISVGNGADEIIYVLLSMFKDLSIYVFPPTYSCYEIFASAVGVKLNRVPLAGERIDLERLKDLNEDCVVFLPNPNNPTGHLFTDEEIFRLLNSGALLVLDEAYYEFSGRTYAPLIEDYSNLIVVRTFSKAFGLASQRIGYLIANTALIDAYNRIRLPYNVSYTGQLFATVALKNRRIFEERIERIVEERERLKSALRRLGFNVSDSKANFVFVYLDQKEAERIHRALLERGITVRKTGWGLRISVGQTQQNDLVIETLEGLM